MEHSKLPWKIDKRREHLVFCDNNAIVVIATAEHELVSSDEATANAAYIVKACNAFPAMLEALEMMDICLKREVCGDCPMDSKCPPDGSSQIVKQALALAKGE